MPKNDQPELFASPSVPVCHPGELWQLGEHLLLVGDSTSEQDVALLFSRGSTKASAIITDPPYGEIQAAWDKATVAFVPFLAQVTLSTATLAFFCSLPYGFDLHTALITHKWVMRYDQVWEKKNAGPLVSKYQPLKAHEYIWAYARTGIPPTQLIFNGYEAGEGGKPWGDNWHPRKTTPGNGVYALTPIDHEGRPDGKRWIRSVLSGKKKQELPESQRTIHPSQKPLELVTKLVLLLSNPGEIVYDCFLGSGTTLLACEKTGRRCYAIEQSPEYCTLIIDQWQKITGKPAALVQQRMAWTA